MGAMETDAEEQPQGLATATERSLASLKSFTRIAWEECREPLSETAGSAEVRREIHSTWTLLLCIHHAEAEAERCRRTWKPQPWRTEAQALRHIFLSSHSVRALVAVLRWLRWAHRYGPSAFEVEELEDASYERTRRALQLQGVLPCAFEAEPALHPDGPLQQRQRFHGADLAGEGRLLAQLWTYLRRGDLRGALQLCADSGQTWRAAMLQGMMPFADGADEAVGYDATGEDEEEDLLAQLKEEHADWAELGAPGRPRGGAGCQPAEAGEPPAASNGNPWRRVWKEQCWDTAQRHLQQRSAMDLHELAVYGLCAGHHAAMAPACTASWADRCWGELHCLKECLVERLLELGREEWSGRLLLGEGDGGVPDGSETPEDRAERSRKLCGKLGAVPAGELEAAVAAEVRRVLARLRADPAVASHPFAELQAALVEAAWAPEHGEVAMGLLRKWLAEGFEGAPCPFLVKQFASYLAIWQKEAITEQPCAEGGQAPQAREAPDVDDIVGELVQELTDAASGRWLQHCLEGQALELIAEHAAALAPERRLEAYARLLLTLGTCTSDSTPEGSLRVEVLKRCVWVFLGRFPHEAFSLMAGLVRRTLRMAGGAPAEEELPDLGPIGVDAGVRPDDLGVTLICIVNFWAALRERSQHDAAVAVEALSGLEALLGRRFEGQEAPRSVDDFARLTLEVAVLPLLTDSLLSLSVKEPGAALAVLPAVQSSALWRDALSSGSVGRLHLEELEWYLGLCHRHLAWTIACEELAEAKRGFDGDAKAERNRSAARDALLDWARPRLARDDPLLEPRSGMHTSLSDEQWASLRRAAACRCLLLLLSAFEGEGDFDGAMHDLAVAAAQSPWLLKLLQPRQVRAFMRRMARIPATFLGARGAAVLGG